VRFRVLLLGRRFGVETCVGEVPPAGRGGLTADPRKWRNDSCRIAGGTASVALDDDRNLGVGGGARKAPRQRRRSDRTAPPREWMVSRIGHRPGSPLAIVSQLTPPMATSQREDCEGHRFPLGQGRRRPSSPRLVSRYDLSFSSVEQPSAQWRASSIGRAAFLGRTPKPFLDPPRLAASARDVLVAGGLYSPRAAARRAGDG